MIRLVGCGPILQLSTHGPNRIILLGLWKQAEGGVRSGWIGAKVGIQQQIGWVSDPDSSQNFLFWRGDGVDGEPYNAASGVPIIPNARFWLSLTNTPRKPGIANSHLSSIRLLETVFGLPTGLAVTT